LYKKEFCVVSRLPNALVVSIYVFTGSEDIAKFER